MSPRLRRTTLLPLAVVCVLLAGCSSDPDPSVPADPDRVVLSPPDPDAPAHTHDTVIGDGTTADAGGFRLTALTFPDRTGLGELSFRIEDSRGEAVTDYVEEQTKLLHLYVVRDDLQDFRHLHPTLADDGTWTAPVDLADPGRYRVVAEFVPADDPGGSHVVLAQRALVEGAWTPVEVDDPSTGSDGLVTIAAPASLPVGVDETMTLTVSDGDRGVLNLGSYLGAYAHLTGFDVETGVFVHAHPLGAPTVTDDGSELQFHTAFATPGRYRFFVQVRVDGFVHTVALGTTVE